jgi:hypothetical protein
MVKHFGQGHELCAFYFICDKRVEVIPPVLAVDDDIKPRFLLEASKLFALSERRISAN